MTPPARLIRLHRHDLTSVLVTGGTASQRAQVAATFHRESPARRGALVSLDGVNDDLRLRASLQARMSAIAPVVPGDPLRAAETGTLFLDCVANLSLETQRALLAFLLRHSGGPDDDCEGIWRGRVVAGHPESLGETLYAGRFLPRLCDMLDKVRVELPAEAEEHVA